MLTEGDIWNTYDLLLGREPDEAGLAHYLKQDPFSIDDLRASVRESAEYKRREFTMLADELFADFIKRLRIERPWRSTMFVASPEVCTSLADTPFMQYSTCSGADFFHPKFAEILAELELKNEMHRKLWEWVFIVHHLRKSGFVAPDRRGLVFGVGKELLPSLFARMGSQITATDAPLEIAIGAGWQSSNEFANGLAAMPEGKLARAAFESLVEWRECDMNNIDPALRDYDFCWSSCCFEHLGSLRCGMDFVLNSVEKTLVPGGIAVHTTEFNLTSNDMTVESGETCIYRRRDIEQLIAELRNNGHQVEPFILAPDSLIVDGYVDLPPYSGPHLKLFGNGFVATSIGLVIKRRDH